MLMDNGGIWYFWAETKKNPKAEPKTMVLHLGKAADATLSLIDTIYDRTIICKTPFGNQNNLYRK